MALKRRIKMWMTKAMHQGLTYPLHAFDVIIADECHRGYTAQEISKWREVLEHFDAVQIGLTATPAAHTTAYFKDIVYRYDYERRKQKTIFARFVPFIT